MSPIVFTTDALSNEVSMSTSAKIQSTRSEDCYRRLQYNDDGDEEEEEGSDFATTEASAIANLLLSAASLTSASPSTVRASKGAPSQTFADPTSTSIHTVSSSFSPASPALLVYRNSAPDVFAEAVDTPASTFLYTPDYQRACLRTRAV